MSSPALPIILRDGLLSDPRRLGNLAAWYDKNDLSLLSNDAGTIPTTGQSIKLVSDKSGNSAVNGLVLNGASGNYASFTALAAIGTGAFSVSAKINTASLSATQAAIGGASSAFSLRVILATGVLEATKVGVSAVSQSTGALTAFGEAVIGYTRTGSTGVYYINGSAVGSVADSTDYSVGITAVGANGAGGTTTPFTGIISWARIYSVALTGPQMLADAGGTVQSNCILDARFDLQTKLATSFTESSSNAATVTINTSGASGARISGARDLYQGTAANQPVLTIAASGNYLTFDGSNDYLKAASFALVQPTTVYFVGSQVTNVSGRRVWDGDSTAIDLNQTATGGGANGVQANAGSAGPTITSWAIGARAVITAVYNNASSALRANRETATTGTTGTNNLNGFTLGNNRVGSAASNITASEILIYSVAHDKSTQNRVIQMLARRNRIVV